jgi:hypothetical protein
MGVEASRMKVVLLAVLVFVGGFAAGAVVVGGLASRASRAYLKGAQLAFLHEQDRLLSEAWRAGRVQDAVAHAACSLEAERGDTDRRAFDPERSEWTLQLALTDALILRPNEANMTGTRPIREAGARARLAIAWDRLGQPAAAERELAEAARLTGKPDAAGWRRHGEQTVDSWSQAMEKVGAEGSAVRQP